MTVCTGKSDYPGHLRHMTCWLIKQSYPGESKNEVITTTSEVKASKDINTIYNAVSWFEKNILPNLKKVITRKKLKRRVVLQDILNIHNDDGIRDLVQLKRMAEEIKSGRHIFSLGMPNVKLIRTRDNELLLFDGHHSILAYMAAGRIYLEEIPHMIIADKEKGYVDDKDIIVFYGEHASDIKDCNWKEKVINWQAAKEKQLCKRVQKNMGQLFCAVQKRMGLVCSII